MIDRCRYNYLSTVYKMCPRCGEEIILHGWDVSKHGYEMICPYCGRLIMLCDECDRCSCDWDSNKGTCRKKKKESKIRERLKKELEKAIIPRSIHDPERANLYSDEVWDIINKILK